MTTKMNPFKGVSSIRSKRKSKCGKVEVKQEPGIKEEPNGGDDVMNIPRPRVDGRYRANYEGPVDFGYDFDEIKDEVKCEEKETGNEKDTTPCDQPNEGAANDNGENEEPMGDAIHVQPPQPVGGGKKRNGSCKGRHKRPIPRNQAAKKQKKHKCHEMNPFKCVSGIRKRKSKCGKVEVKQEPGIKEEPNDSDDVMHIPRPRVDGRYHAIYKGPVDFGHDFDEVKDEMKCEEEEMGKDKGSTPCERSNESAAVNDDENEDPMGDAIDVEPPKQFIRQIHLNQHLSTAHSDRFPFQCSKCFRGYATKDEKVVHEDSCGHRVSGRRSKRKSKSAKVEVKQEPGIKEEPNDGDDVINIPRSRVDGRYRVNYEKPFDFGHDFDEIKSEVKREEEETGEEKDSKPRERSNESAANDDDNEEPMGDAFDVQPPQPVGGGKKRNGSSKRRDKEAIPRNQAAKKQKKHKCHVCNHFTDRKFDLIRHLRSHSGEKPFECSICFKSFARNPHLRSHSMTHKDELPNALPLQNCLQDYFQAAHAIKTRSKTIDRMWNLQ
ncbi:histone-lysine N-methyltransferase PRDM9-like [Sitodiplosis mosellana]|uniref:histone-lysine N-methyltransferase PRDM9-like n=1 Tax=Sitodiplosis mosellana TaxID=263140 RepID=UPI0024448060|nr:histone-lysine N-methyltransferase PRDM9-like [Sitodiplosis mosellana]